MVELIFQPDSASCDVAKVFKQLFQDNYSSVLEWPETNSDLNQLSIYEAN